MNDIETLIAEGRALLACVDPELLPLDVDHAENDCFVCDRNGLEFAVPREADQQTAELIAWLINNGGKAFDALQRVSELAERWDAAIELDTQRPSIVTQAFAAALRDALDGHR